MHASRQPSTDHHPDDDGHGAPSVQLWTLDRDEFGGFGTGSAVTALGDCFIGHVALAVVSHALVIAGRVDDAHVTCWTAVGSDLHPLGALAATTDEMVVIVDLVFVANTWHLLGLDAHGRSTHHISNDLQSWQRLRGLDSAFPAFAVSGVSVHGDGLLLAGRVVVDRATYGWGLLAFDGTRFEARPVPVPLSSQLHVVGPVVGDSDEVVLLLDSGTTHTVARSNGRGWTLSLLTPSMVPTSAFALDQQIWMAGHCSGTDGPAIARVGSAQVHEVGGAGCGLIRSAVAVGGQVVLACDLR